MKAEGIDQGRNRSIVNTGVEVEKAREELRPSLVVEDDGDPRPMEPSRLAVAMAAVSALAVEATDAVVAREFLLAHTPTTVWKTSDAVVATPSLDRVAVDWNT